MSEREYLEQELRTGREGMPREEKVKAMGKRRRWSRLKGKERR